MAAPPIPTFYQCRDFTFKTNRVVPRALDRTRVRFSAPSRAPFEPILSYFSEVTFERTGILHGEYVVLRELILVRRDGMCIKANMSWEDASASQAMDDFCNTLDFDAAKKAALGQWDSLACVGDAPLISHPYAGNYYHWTLEAIPTIRFYESARFLAVPAGSLRRPFHRDLLSFVAQNKKIGILNPQPIRLRDPRIAHEPMSENGVQWLREKTALRAKPGDRRVYVRRGEQVTRTIPGGGISESPDFRSFLIDHNFETVEFGSELSIEQQIRLLDGAGVVLASHGAALTNLLYMNAPLLVIEVVGARTPRANFIHLANFLGFHYWGVFSHSYDGTSNIVVDVEQLREAIKEIGA
jgi:capsular polysaccharide biosynthesis protein